MKWIAPLLLCTFLASCGSGGPGSEGVLPATTGDDASTAVDAVEPAPFVEFVETKGEREFTGRLIARPVQVPASARGPAEITEAITRQTKARELITKFRVADYVVQVDEYLIDVPVGSTENETAKKLMATGNFQYVEPDWRVFPISCPNDTFFAQQWHHDSSHMQSCDGWNINTGNPSVAVGICDTGILTTHEDFQLHRLEGYNAVDRQWESQGGAIGPVHSHGTQTTGCAAANGNNGKGVSGVGWNLSHRMLRVSNSTGGGSTISVLTHAAQTSIENGDKVASVSYSGVTSNSVGTTATYIKSLGGLLCWAAGNSNTNLTNGDRDADDVIVCGATDSNDLKASFSSYGPLVDVVAPGVSVATASTSSNSSYVLVSGTSFSCPLTAGLVAMIWSTNPSLTPDQVEGILKQGCDDLGAPGVDNTYGYGRINLNNSLLLAAGPPPSGPTAQFSGTPTSGTAPLTVQFSDLSTGNPTSWSWDFGDSGTSTSQNPAHTYNAAGTYTVTLTVSNSGGSDDEQKIGYITVDPQGGYTGQGFILSKNADFSTDDRTFSRNDTLYMLVWSDQVDFNNMKRSEWELKAGRRDRVKGGLSNNFDNSHTAAFQLSGLPSNAASWTWRGKIEDTARKKFQPTVTIAITD